MSGSTSINTNLVSPGVSVQIIPEVYYGSGAPSTIPLIVFATQSNKPSPTTSGTIAPYTSPERWRFVLCDITERSNPEFRLSVVHSERWNDHSG